MTFYRDEDHINIDHPNTILPLSNLAKDSANYFSVGEDGKPGTAPVAIPPVSDTQLYTCYIMGRQVPGFRRNLSIQRFRNECSSFAVLVANL